jgi:hypothetical protein
MEVPECCSRYKRGRSQRLKEDMMDLATSIMGVWKYTSFMDKEIVSGNVLKTVWRSAEWLYRLHEGWAHHILTRRRQPQSAGRCQPHRC